MKSKFLIAAGLCMALAAQAQTGLSKRDIMDRFLDGTLDGNYAPAAFFMHFGKDAKTGDAAVNAHLRYFLSTGMDIVKVQFEQGYGRIRIEKPEDVLSEGQTVEAKITAIDEEKQKISLSIRALLAPAADEEDAPVEE